MTAVTPTVSTAKTQGPLYQAAHYGTAYLNVPPNMHRLRNAVGLTVGLYLGRKTMDILAGETPEGKKIDKHDLPAPLRPLHGILAYDHFSDDPKDRWMKVFDMLVPGIVGGLGAAMGSVSFYQNSFMKPVEAKMTAKAKDFSLIDAEKRALYIESKPWGLTSAVAAIFGSASGFGLFPSFLNYSSTLGTTFTLRAERAMPSNWLSRAASKLFTGDAGALFNSYSREPLRPSKQIAKLAEYLSGNPDLHPKELTERAYGILKPLFKKVTPEQVEAFANQIKQERDLFIKDGKLPHEAQAKVQKALSDMLKDSGLESQLIKAGIDPREVSLGDHGFITTIARWIGDSLGFGTSKKLAQSQNLLIKGLEERHPGLQGKAFTPAPLSTTSTGAKVASAGFLAAGVGTLGLISTAKDAEISDLHTTAANTNMPGGFAQKVEKDGKKPHIVHSKKDYGFINGKGLDAAEGVAGMLNASIGMHRIHCAVGLTVGSWLGDEVMKALTGVSFMGAAVKKTDVLKPLQKLYKTMAFNPHSDHPNDKWMQILRWAIPGIIGGAAVMAGSGIFFSKRKESIKQAQTLDEIEDKASFEQSKPWSYTAAITSLCGYGTGLGFLPITSYSTNLGTRFSMASGRKVSLPIVGKIWSNNPTLFPFGPPGMLDLIIKEAVNNKAYDPEMLETYSIGVLKPWFEQVTPQQIEAFVGKVHEIRDKFYKEGGVPEDLKKQLETELRAHLKGAGLEDTLTQIGLDPATAHIANSGLSGKIANMLGAKGAIDKIKSDYVEGYRARHQQKNTPSPTGPGLA